MQFGKPMSVRRILCIAVVVQLILARPAAADRLVLRNLDIISDKTVTGFDVDGVQLNDGTIIPWDRIEKGTVAEAEQAAFDKMLSQLGSDLYRLRQRLTVSDYKGLLPHAEAVYPAYRGRRSETAYMVCQALMWARLAVGHREASLQPYLECVECLRQAAAEKRSYTIPGPRQLPVDLQTGLSPELPPVWFDAEAATAALAGVADTIAATSKPRPPAMRIYYATLALAAGETEKAVQALSGLDELPEWKAVVEAQIQLSQHNSEVARQALERQIDRFSADLKPLALYWLGQAQLAGTEPGARQAGVLDLLRIAALYGSQQPELAAAGLYVAMGTLAQQGDAKGSIAIRRELLDRYGQTWHAERLRQEDMKVK